MNTLKSEIKISGKGLMSGLESNVTIFPGQEKGINFYVANSKTPVKAGYKNVISTDNCVVLGNAENSRVILVEHLMSACAFAGIDSLDVCVDSPELPIVDGSAAEWYKMLSESIQQNDIQDIRFENPLAITDNNADIALIPAEELKITYCLNFDHPDLRNRWVSFDLTNNKMEILSARTFGYYKDLEKFQQAGMALGVTAENTVGLTEEGYTTELRTEFEPVKHKIQDLIGDLYLSGFNPLGFKAHIIAKEAGHRSHIKFAELINAEINSLLKNKR